METPSNVVLFHLYSIQNRPFLSKYIANIGHQKISKYMKALENSYICKGKEAPFNVCFCMKYLLKFLYHTHEDSSISYYRNPAVLNDWNKLWEHWLHAWGSVVDVGLDTVW